MCVSNNFVEQQAEEYSKKIQENTHYKFVRQENITTSPERHPLITNVVLADEEGTYYSVVPNENGLRFAKQEITYNEYKRIENKDTFTLFGVFGVSITCLAGLMVAFIKVFT